MTNKVVIVEKSKSKKKKMMTRKARRAAALAVAALAAGPRTQVRGKKAKLARDAFSRVSNAPVNTSFKYATRVPAYRGVRGGVRIAHTEYIGDLVSSNSSNQYHCQNMILNPANSDTFPWLSTQASCYAGYRFRSVKFHVGSLVATSTGGMYAMACTSDANDGNPVSKYTFLQYQNAARNNVWEPATYNVPAAVLKRLPEYLTSSGNTGSALNGTKATGKLFVCSAGIATGSLPYGELYVTYDVELFTSQTPSADAFNNFAYTATSNNLFGASAGDWTTGSIGGTIDVVRLTSNRLEVHAAGELIVTISLDPGVSGSVTTTPVFSGLTMNGTVVTFGTLSGWGATGQTGSTMAITFRVNNAGKPWYLDCTSGTFTGPVNATIIITRDWSGPTDQLSSPGHVDGSTLATSVPASRQFVDDQVDMLRRQIAGLLQDVHDLKGPCRAPAPSDSEDEYVHPDDRVHAEPTMSDSVVLAARRVLSSLSSSEKK